MTELDNICHNIRGAFRKRDKEALTIYSKILWNYLNIEGWKLGDDYWSYADKHLLDKGIACTIQSFILNENSNNGFAMRYAFMIQAIHDLGIGLGQSTNSKHVKAEFAYWMFFCICSNISLLQDVMNNTLREYGKTVNEENLTIIPFLILNYLHQFCIEKDYVEMTYTPLFDGKNGLNEEKYFQLLNRYQDMAIPLIQMAANNANVEFDLESLKQESELAYEYFLINIRLEKSSSIYKSIMKY
ncbi:hypothetical protein [Caecibacteroides pullorum]|uniref:Uncharacterized protein n=1 Tax=Caecibacteroides pullorum TaxID=2725562 RepID=A0AA41D9G3_9BACT|nr:hypothetical protein [Caecibacteroides pullorum]MBM6858258.1 hypothetical protein [Caecibacteroides pullorum]MBV8059304.1 hypothetical protein [Caecibacteroides pullorum]